MVSRNAQAQAQLINDLIDMSRVTASKLHLDLEPLSIGPILDAAVESLRTAAAAKGLAIHTSWPVQPARSWPTRPGSSRCSVIFYRMPSSSPHWREVWLTAECQGECVRVTVTDSGVGI